MAAVSLQSLKEHLESQVDVVESLQHLNTLMGSSPDAVSEVLSVVSLPLLFSCLETEDSEQVNVTCSLLDKLLCHIPAQELVKYGHYMELGLQYPEAKVAKTCLQALHNFYGEKLVDDMILAPTMLHLITQLIGMDDLEPASLAAKLLLQYSTQSDILVTVLKGAWLNELNQLLQLNDTVRYRVYDVVVQTCLQGGVKCFEVMKAGGLLDKLVGELETEDPLVKMNCVELLAALAGMKEGVVFLKSSNVLEKLYSVLISSQDVMGALVIPGTNTYLRTSPVSVFILTFLLERVS